MKEHTVSWFVRIDRAIYEVTFLGDSQGWQLLQLEGRHPGASYQVQTYPDGSSACSCPDGANRHRPCKHAQALQALGSIGRPKERAIG